MPPKRQRLRPPKMSRRDMADFQASSAPLENVAAVDGQSGSVNQSVEQIDTWNAKKMKLDKPAEGIKPDDAVNGEAFEALNISDDDKLPPESKPKTRKQTASAQLSEHIQAFSISLSAIMGRHYNTHIGDRCTRNGCSEKAMYRCMEGCFGRHLMCASCLVKSHEDLPYHWAEHWNGDYFERKDMKDLGLTIGLGHDGYLCPNRAKKPFGMVVAHVNGIHHCDFFECHCPDCPPVFVQLEQLGLYPATLNRPSTAFTFELLNDFHMHALVSKKVAYDHYTALLRHTDPTSIDSVEDRYRELLRISRVWFELTSQRRSGEFMNINEHQAEGMPPLTRAIFCPACPLVGFNMTKAEMEAVPYDERHKVAFFASGDGNFRLQRMQKLDDPDDVALNGARAYFVEDDAYNRFMKSKGHIEPVQSTCVRLQVLKQQLMSKFKNVKIAGIFAWQCGRHGFFIGHGVVDLDCGEKFPSVDYALHGVLDLYRDCRFIYLVYDIMCQYIVHLLDRFKADFPDLAPIVERVVGLIPKLHVMGHMLRCLYLMSLMYTPKVGRTYAEMIESGWSVNNQAAGATKQMNHGHRHDRLDDNFGHYNWEKLIGLAHHLSNNLITAIRSVRECKASFQALCDTHDPELLKQWEQMPKDSTATGKGKNDYETPYEMCKKFKVPTQASVYKELQEQEYTPLMNEDDSANLKQAISMGACGFTETINMGLRIENEQVQIKKCLSTKENMRTETDISNIKTARANVSKLVQSYRELQYAVFPVLHDRIQDAKVKEYQPEDQPLFLPSETGRIFWERGELNDVLSTVPRIEYKLREGQAYDALDKLKKTIIHEYGACNQRKKNVASQKDSSRGGKFIQNLDEKRNGYRNEYCRVRNALVVLGMAVDDPILRDLQKGDCWMKDPIGPHQLGGGVVLESWIWSVAGQTPMDPGETKEYEREAKRVQWARERANLERWEEEVEMLEAEFGRCKTAHRTMHKTWTDVALGASDPGTRAYSMRTAAIYKRLEEGVDRELQRAYSAAVRDKPKAQQPPQRNAIIAYENKQLEKEQREEIRQLTVEARKDARQRMMAERKAGKTRLADVGEAEGGEELNVPDLD